MSVVSSAMTVTTTAKLIASPKPGRKQLMVYPDGSVTVYIGGSGVTGATNGAPLAPGDPPFSVYAEWSGDLSAGQAFYAVAASGSATCPVIEIVY